jgi:hypothetical protein
MPHFLLLIWNVKIQGTPPLTLSLGDHSKEVKTLDTEGLEDIHIQFTYNSHTIHIQFTYDSHTIHIRFTYPKK